MTTVKENMRCVPDVPSVEFLKIATMLRHHEILVSMEKTAAVSAKLVDKENEILSSFYKQAFWGKAVTMGKNLWQGAKTLGQSTYHAARRGVQDAALANQVGGQGFKDSMRAGMQGAGQAFREYGGAGMMQRNKGKLIGGGMLAAGGVGYGMAPSAQRKRSKYAEVAEQFMSAGYDLAKTANIAVPVEGIKDSLEKLATIGVMNCKLQTVISDPQTSPEVRAEAIKLGQENNRHCIEVLKELAFQEKTALDAATAGAAVSKSMFNSSGRVVKGPGSGGPSIFSSIGDSVKGLFGGGDLASKATAQSRSGSGIPGGMTQSSGKVGR